MSIKTRNLSEGFSSFSDHWSPKICGTVNDMHLKLVKVQGDFNWHHHVDEDELFLVMKGVLRVKLRDPEERTEVVKAGEFIIIPKGIEHCPCADAECEIILMEPKGTLNTGNVVSDKTVETLDTLYD